MMKTGTFEQYILCFLIEKKKKGWDDHRKVLEEVLMERPTNFVRSFLDVYAQSNGNVQLTKDITDKLGHNKFLTFGYLSLGKYNDFTISKP